VCAQLLGFSEKIDPNNELPPSVKEVRGRPADPLRVLPKVDARRIRIAQSLGNGWESANYRIDPPEWTFYYLYALERYWAFRDSVEGEKKQFWYNDGAKYLIRTQQDNGSWIAKQGGTPVNTAFGALFLLRSSKKSLQHAYYYRSSTMVAAHGLPRNLSRVTLRNGKVVAQPSASQAASWLDCLAHADDPGYAEALEILNFLPATEANTLVDKENEKLRQLAAGGSSPELRMAVVRVLADSDNMEQVPTLVARLSDADLAVVCQSNEALRQLSRKISGFELSEHPSPAERQTLIEKWKAWYLAICPNAEFLN
jgi:hypothetical protein